MKNSDWMKETCAFSTLRESAEDYSHLRSVVDWLKAIDIIPSDVVYMKPVKAKLDLDPHRIERGYIAATAFEWDSWGPSSPEDFINAIACELKGSPQRDFIAGLLTLLGREKEGVDALAVA